MSGQSINPVMLELFRTELETHARALGEGLLQLEEDPRPAPRWRA